MGLNFGNVRIPRIARLIPPGIIPLRRSFLYRLGLNTLSEETRIESTSLQLGRVQNGESGRGLWH
jgi:hypothetical protein